MSCSVNTCPENCCTRYGNCVDSTSADPYQQQCYYYYHNYNRFPDYGIAIIVTIGVVCLLLIAYCIYSRRKKGSNFQQAPMQPGVIQNNPNNFHMAPQSYSSQNALTPQTQYQLVQGLTLN